MKNILRRVLSLSVCGILLTAAPGLFRVNIGISAAAAEPDGYRNVALRRAAYQSGANDFYQTAQLVTDGIYSMDADNRIQYSAQYPNADSPAEEQLPNLFDGITDTKYLTFHNTGWVQIYLPQRLAVKGVSSYLMASANDDDRRDPADWTLQGSDDGVTWKVLDTKTGYRFTARQQVQTFNLPATYMYTYYRLNITGLQDNTVTSADGRPLMQLSRWDLLDSAGNTLLKDDMDFGFNSTWVSAGPGEEYVYIDLGAASLIDKAVLYWPDGNYAKSFDLQTSGDAKTWTTVYSQTAGTGGVETCSFTQVQATYIRLLCHQSNGGNYVLSEMEVWGANDLNYSLAPLPAPEADGTQYLRGGSWQVERASEVKADGAALSSAGADTGSWLPATVPGTVLTSYFNAGAVPDMRVANYITAISDSYFTADFWYRDTFTVPASQQGKHTWLNFDAINWKADVYLNGALLGSIDGAFIRGRFDITALANYGGDNYLAVYIHANDNPGKIDLKNAEYAGVSGGAIGLDSPSISASTGWDWVPTIPGRDIGIYGDVSISYSQDVTVQDPLVITKLSDNNTKATLTVKALLSNPTNAPVSTKVTGTITPSGLAFNTTVTVPANALRKEYVIADGLTMNNPNLWWPNTYGDQFLYDMTLAAADAATLKQSDSLFFKFGVRELTYQCDPSINKNNVNKYQTSDKGKEPLSLYCNGVHIILRGGNWGMDDANLAATADDYDVKLRLSAEENFTMIRNWVGMTRNAAFYDACDKYGILIWNDFWLANPVDGPDPADDAMFLANAVDNVYRIRQHASLAIYAGRNEGPPPDALDASLRQLTADQDGTRFYVSFSADDLLTGEGFTYSAQTPSVFFTKSYPDRQLDGILQVEKGFPNVPNYESLMKMLTDQYAWPRNDVWGIHDFCGPQNGYSAVNADSYESMMQSWYGSYDNLQDFARIAQMMDYEGMKAMFEGMYYADREGLLMWMAQSAWPSFIWQTYDYYYDTNAGYFGLKKGTAPLAAYWPNAGNADDQKILLRNATKDERDNLNVVLEIYDLNGKKVYSDQKTVSVAADSSLTAMDLPTLTNVSDVRFLKTMVYDGSTLVSDDFYWMNARKAQDYKALTALPWVNLTKTETKLPDAANGDPRYAVTITNPANTPALMTRLMTLDSATGEQMLPVYYVDIYVSLMPGESQTITLEIDKRYSSGTPRFELEGWNITPTGLAPGAVTSQPGLFLNTTVNNLYSADVLAKTAAPAEIGTDAVYVENLADGSLAKAIGLRQNDLIVKYMGDTVTGAACLAELYNETPNGIEVILKVWRENRYIKITFIKGAGNSLYTVPGKIQADDWSALHGGLQNQDNSEGGQSLAFINNGDWAVYKNINFASVSTGFTLRAATVNGAATVTVRLDSATGPVIATVPVTGTGDWQAYQNFSPALANTALLTGVHDVYLCFSGGVNVNWFEFLGAGAPPEVPYGPGDPETPILRPIAYGDVNGDGKIDTTDARLVLQYIVQKITSDGLDLQAADVNRDGAVNTVDARLILQYIVKKIGVFPTES